MNSLIPIDSNNYSLIHVNQDYVYYKKEGKHKRINCKKEAGAKARSMNNSGSTLLSKIDIEKHLLANSYVLPLIMKGTSHELSKFLKKSPLKPLICTRFGKESYHIVFLIKKCLPADGEAIADALVVRFKKWDIKKVNHEYLPIPGTKYWSKNKSYPVSLISSMQSGYDASYFIERMSLDVWLTPISLDSACDGRRPIDKQDLPDFIFSFGKTISKSIGCPLDNVIIPMLVMIASLIHHKLHIQPTSARSYLLAINLWGTVVLPSGSKKSPPLRYLTEFLKPLQESSNLKYEEDKVLFEQKQRKNIIKNRTIEKEAEKALKDTLHLDCDDPEKLQAEYDVDKLLKDLVNTDTQLPRKLYTLSDFTPAAFVEKMIQNPNGFLLLLDELFSLFEKVSRKENESLRGFFLTLFDSFGIYEKALRTEKDRDCSDRTISIIGSTQPDKIRPIITKALNGSADNDGWLNRFQLMVSPILSDTNNLNSTDIDIVLEEEFEHFIRALEKTNFGFSKDCSIKDRTIKFSPNAQKLFDHYTQQNNNEIVELMLNPENAVYASQLQKYPSLLAKLATLFNVVDSWKQNNSLKLSCVRSKFVTQAIGFTNYLQSHAHYILGNEANITHVNAKRIATELRRFNDGYFTTAEIKRFDWSGLGRDTKPIQDALNYLVGLNILKIGKAPKANSELWLINPLFLTK